MPSVSDRTSAPSEMRCLVCDSSTITEVPGFAGVPRITSDCRPFPKGGRLGVCPSCGGVQKFPDSTWLSEIAGIYANYHAYHQAEGEEQIVLDPRTGQPRRRSAVLLEYLSRSARLPSHGTALDVGCGTGVTLQAMSKALEGWQLFGQDLDDRQRERLQEINGFSELFVGPLASINAKFDLVSMVHSLEHFEDPHRTLRDVGAIMRADGILFVEVVNVEENPFDILVADHILHFGPSTLRRLAERAGFEIVALETDCVRKELSLVATPSAMIGSGPPEVSRVAEWAAAAQLVERQLGWLSQAAEIARTSAATAAPFGVFGTSIAATWLATVLLERIEFFVDEDPSRVGKAYMGKPVLNPFAVPPGATIFLALAPVIAKEVARRLASLPVKLVLPSAMSMEGG